MTDRPFKTRSRFFLIIASLVALVFLPACGKTHATPTSLETEPSPTESRSPTQTVTPARTTSQQPPVTATPGPSPTSTPLPPLQAQGWLAQPVMIEAAQIGSDSRSPADYTPFFVLYGDGLLIKRSCVEDACRYLQTQLSQQALCQLVNAVDRTGFLNAAPPAWANPAQTGAETRLAVQVSQANAVQIPDLDRWATTPGWASTVADCPACSQPPAIDPAYLDLYRLLTTYEERNLTPLEPVRLAVWLTKPILVGTPQPWGADLISLSDLADQSICPENPTQTQAVVLEGTSAHAIANFLSTKAKTLPLFIEDERIWQVQSRWLLPYEMPRQCQHPTGFYPPAEFPEIFWQCNPAMGAIPTFTPTITATPTITLTPLR